MKQCKWCEKEINHPKKQFFDTVECRWKYNQFAYLLREKIKASGKNWEIRLIPAP